MEVAGRQRPACIEGLYAGQGANLVGERDHYARCDVRKAHASSQAVRMTATILAMISVIA
jgi:hypothetical protein